MTARASEPVVEVSHPSPLPELTLRARAARALNTVLGRFGYAFIRIKGDMTQFRLKQHDGMTLAYMDVRCSDIVAPWILDHEFKELHRRIESHTMVDVYRCYELVQLVREVAHVPGDIVEVGVWRGGTGVLLADAARKWKPGARVWLCDTFAGVVKATSRDSQYIGGEHADTSEDIVRDLVNRECLTNVTTLKGMFPDETGGKIANGPIALCHIDVDVYQSAADIVAWASPRMAANAILVFDDYGFSSCRGITQLVDELRATGEWIYIYNLNKHAILIKR